MNRKGVIRTAPSAVREPIKIRHDHRIPAVKRRTRVRAPLDVKDSALHVCVELRWSAPPAAYRLACGINMRIDPCDRAIARSAERTAESCQPLPGLGFSNGSGEGQGTNPILVACNERRCLGHRFCCATRPPDVPPRTWQAQKRLTPTTRPPDR